LKIEAGHYLKGKEMNLIQRFALGLAACGLAFGASDAGSAGMTKEEAVRELAGANQQQTPAAMWVWTDKYTYRPGEQLTVRWTLKPNNDLYPYTIVAYRQNNQSGVKTYLPGNTTTPTDIAGRSFDQGYRISALPTATKGVLVGAGGSVVSSPLTVPNEPGMHTIVVQLRDYTGTRVVKAAYFKFGVVTETVVVSGNIETNTTWNNTRLYRLSGVVFVRNARLTIEPGTIIVGTPGSTPPSALIVTRTGQISASGTKSRPIIMTSSEPFGQRQPGDWGGLVMLGTARTNIQGGFGNIEGLPATDDTRFGGTDDNHNCGTLKYVRVEYAGVPFQPNQEINSITMGACGRDTQMDHLQVRYGRDDAYEWFGGTSDAKYLVASFTQDDYFDIDNGYTGRLQYAIAVAGTDTYGNNGIEADGNNNNRQNTPFTQPTWYNMTFVGVGDTIQTGIDEGANVGGLWLRRNVAGSFNNIIVSNWINTGAVLRDELGQVQSGNLRFDGLMLWANGGAVNRPNTREGQVAGGATVGADFYLGNTGQGRQYFNLNPMFRRPFEASDPDFRTNFGSNTNRTNWVQPPDDGFFDQGATFIGAFGDEDWTEEWVCWHKESDVAP
jgi:hypothetical protein